MHFFTCATSSANRARPHCCPGSFPLLENSTMHNDKRLLSGLLIGAVAVIGGFAAHAHEWHPRGDGMQGGNFLSISGSPEELSKRTRELGEHICETIKPGTDCPVSSISDTAANELAAMQESFAEGQGRLHAALTTAKFDRTAVDQVQAAQATAIHAGEVRYLRFLGDAAASLTPNQRQLFSRNGHAGQ
ncbi:MAG: hypothetical protein WAR01_11335 [Dokdonella sp.]|nr:periplasmic heavy metal sensor [Xanthomonadales bacterium]HQV72822.1 hypothetical protein [Dokdonella sp.]